MRGMSFKEAPMLKQIFLYPVASILFVAGFAAAETPRQPIGSSALENNAMQPKLGHGMAATEFPANDPIMVPARGSGPTPVLLREIVTWLTANFRLPATRELPAVKLVPAAELPARRIKRVQTNGAQVQDFANPAVQAPYRREVVAVYNTDTRTILLADSWTGKTPADISIVVHEMVHHLQTIGKLKYECAGAREKPAYLAQDKWLNKFGMNLAKEFQVDRLTLLVASSCLL